MKALEEFRKWGVKKAHPILLTVIGRYLHAWIWNKNFDMTERLIRSDPIHKKIHQAIQEQNSIGWGHVLHGRLSCRWREAQLMADKKNKRGERKGFMANMISELWKQMREIWIHRNSYQHGMTAEEREAKKRASVGPRVRAAYRQRNTDNILVHQRLFRLDLGRRLKFSPEENERWLEVVETAIKFKRVREEAVLAATRRMTDFYTSHRAGQHTEPVEDSADQPEEKETRWKQRSLKEFTHKTP